MTMAILGKNILRLIPNILRYNGLMFSRVFFFMMLNDANINRIGYNFVDCQYEQNRFGMLAMLCRTDVERLYKEFAFNNVETLTNKRESVSF